MYAGVDHTRHPRWFGANEDMRMLAVKSGATDARAVADADVLKLPARERRVELRRVVAADSPALRSVSRLHMELLDYGPMAGLGELFIREAIYRPHIDAGALHAFLYRVDGEDVGFVAYTEHSTSFHRGVLREHWLRAGGVLLLALLQDPRRIRNVIRALRVLLSRRGERQLELEQNALGEVVCIAVRRDFVRAGFVRATGRRPSADLVRMAATRLRSKGQRRMRMLVDADNREVLFLYHLLGARFEPYEQAGEAMIQVWFDLDSPELTGAIDWGA